MHHILVVDDFIEICELLKDGFEAARNYRVTWASTKVDALAALRRERLDLTLLDVILREKADAEIEALAAERGVPVLRMTGHP